MPCLVFQQKAESQWLLFLGIFGLHYAEGGQVLLKAQMQSRKAAAKTTYSSMQAIDVY